MMTMAIAPQPAMNPDALAAQEHWRAVVERDGRFDGVLFYGVRSTHIYCKPSCPSRRPRPERVQFFFAPIEAESAGFRACKRCRPTHAPADTHLAMVRSVCRHIEENLEGSLTLEELGSVAA